MWSVVPHPSITVAVTEDPSGDTRGWHDIDRLDGAAVAAILAASKRSLSAVEDVLRTTRHREFAVSVDTHKDVRAILGGPLTEAEVYRDPEVFWVRDGAVDGPVPIRHSFMWLTTHNHPGSGPVSGPDIVNAIRLNCEYIRAVTSGGTWQAHVPPHQQLDPSQASSFIAATTHAINAAERAASGEIQAAHDGKGVRPVANGRAAAATREYADEFSRRTAVHLGPAMDDVLRRFGLSGSVRYSSTK